MVLASRRGWFTRDVETGPRFSTRRPAVVIVALDDYESLEEAAYLLRGPENARRLLASIDRLESGAGTPVTFSTLPTSEARLGRGRLGRPSLVAPQDQTSGNFSP
jgi:hypothetical protein